MDLLNFRPGEKFLKKTISRCTTCNGEVPAEVIQLGPNDGSGKIVMRRTCPIHGTQDCVISSDSRFYYVAQGKPKNSCGEGCGCGTARSASNKSIYDGTLGSNAVAPDEVLGETEKLATCLALIEIVDSCNLACPTCFAASPHGIGANTKFRSFENVTDRISGVISRKGPIEIIQFSGGEPTIHPEFFKLVEWVIMNPDIEVLLINTNGVRLARDAEFIAEMQRVMEMPEAHKIQLYLQFDGPQLDGQKELRGADLRAIRELAIKNCEAMDLPITLAMTVTRQNLPYLWESVQYALPFENIRGISFQPMFLSGRNPSAQLSEDPLNTADIILGLNSQSKENISLRDFTSLPCGDPNCACIGWGFRLDGKYYSPTAFGLNISAMQSTLPDKINYNEADLAKCGCDNTVLGEMMRQFEKPIARTFRLFIKPFMDARSWDKDRTDRCCTHVIAPDGSLRSFCEYYYG